MVATLSRSRHLREAVLAELTEAALAILAGHDVGGYSIDLEIALWKKLEESIAAKVPWPQSLPAWRECCLAIITRAVYEVALEHGHTGSFLDLELSLWSELGTWLARAGAAPSQAGQLHTVTP